MIWQIARKRAAQEDGVFALLTLVFFALCGIVCILIVWGIGQASAIYNIAYFSTQAAATASVGAAEANDKGLIISCGDKILSAADDFICDQTTADVYQIAVNSLNTSLASGTQGTFGLVGPTGSNPLAGPRLVISSLQVYNITPEAGAAGRARGCSYVDTSQDAGYINNLDSGTGDELTGSLGCWRVQEKSIRSFPEQYQTGVVLRTNTDVPLIPFCTSGSGTCPTISILATGAARVVQNSAPANYELYNCYGKSRDTQEITGGSSLDDCNYESVF